MIPNEYVKYYTIIYLQYIIIYKHNTILWPANRPPERKSSTTSDYLEAVSRFRILRKKHLVLKATVNIYRTSTVRNNVHSSSSLIDCHTEWRVTNRLEDRTILFDVNNGKVTEANSQRFLHSFVLSGMVCLSICDICLFYTFFV